MLLTRRIRFAIINKTRKELPIGRLIFHIDVNSAFLSWEATRRVCLGEEDIRLSPSAIGGDRDKQTGVILAKSIPAKKFGIKTGEHVVSTEQAHKVLLALTDSVTARMRSDGVKAYCVAVSIRSNDFKP